MTNANCPALHENSAGTMEIAILTIPTASGNRLLKRVLQLLQTMDTKEEFKGLGIQGKEGFLGELCQSALSLSFYEHD